MTRRTIYVACAASFIIGLLFVFVWAPHPWGWQGFDDYYDYGRSLARGEAFPTMDRPWGYAYFLAAFYRLFGDRPWIPLLAQAALNALMPLLVYLFARDEFDDRVAVVAALLVGFFSFNTVYASTQSADAVCNLLFMAAVVVFARARRRDDWRGHAAAGALIGVAAQLRPNLILLPILLAALLVIEHRNRARAMHASVLILASIVTLVPWVIRNQRLAGEPMLTTTHGAMQLWYGTLQSGPYLKSRAHNPRTVFETGSFPYTSLDRLPLVVTGRVPACTSPPAQLAVVYWTDRDRERRRVPVQWPGAREFQAEIPPSPAPTTYYVDVDGAGASGETSPSVYFVSADHLGDLDRHDDLLDVFDLIRMMRSVAWNEPLPISDRLDFDGDGRISERDVRMAVSALLARGHAATSDTADALETIRASPAAVALALEGSSLIVPRQWSGRITDVEVTGEPAAALVHATAPFASLRKDHTSSNTSLCPPIEDLAINAVFYRREPQAMRRYMALALDNVRRDPAAYLAGVVYRTLRVFFIEASDDPHTTYRFASSGRIYRTAQAVSIALLVLFAAGVWAAWRRGAAIALPLLLIAYIPATLGFVLTNMRYSLTVQPLMFVFIAAALVTAAEASARRRRREGIETARRP
jgi:dolichyl-phosphate-mannose-protein mannosyltransferase